MKMFLKITFVFFIAVYLFSSCRKPKCDENIPAIAFKEFRQYYDVNGKPIPDSAKIILTFKDCNGDIGLEEKDSVAPYDSNFKLQYFEMANGVWKSCDSCSLPYRIPMLTPEGQSKILEGEIGMTIAPFYFNPFSPDSDTIKYKVQLFDRALNESNIVETPMILTR